MTRSVSFHRLADLEMLEASGYYANLGDELAAAFLDEVERASRFIVAHAEGAPPVGGGLQRRVLRKFPYSLYYSIRGEAIRILAVAHQERRPYYWRGRR